MTDDKMPNIEGSITYDDKPVNLRERSYKELIDLLNKTNFQNKQIMEEKEHLVTKQKAQDDIDDIIEDAHKDFKVRRETQLSERETAILHAHTDKEIADALKKHVPAFGPPGTDIIDDYEAQEDLREVRTDMVDDLFSQIKILKNLTITLTDTALENKALKAMTEIGLMYNNLTHSAYHDKSSLKYDWNVIAIYCRDIIKEAQVLKDTATELREEKA